MKFKRFARLMLACILATAIMAPFAGCTTKFKNDEHPFILAIQELDGVFSPFYSTSGYDSEIAGMTQIGMLSIDKEGKIAVGEEQPCVTQEYNFKTTDNRTQLEKDSPNYKNYEEYYTEYEFLIKNGIKFSDGKDLTIKDVLFNLYVYLDPVYVGSNTLYSTDIWGLQEYRQQTDSVMDDAAWERSFSGEAQVRVNYILDLFPKVGLDKGEDNSGNNIENTYKDIAEIKKLFLEELSRDWNTASASLGEFEKEYTVNGTKYVTETWQLFLINAGLINPTRGRDIADYPEGEDPDKLISVDFREWPQRLNNLSEEKIRTFCIDEAFKHYLGTKDDIASTHQAYWSGADISDKINDLQALCDNLTDILYRYETGTNFRTHIINELKTAKFQELRNKDDGSLYITSVKGITTREESNTFTDFNGKTVSLNGEKHDVLTVRIAGVDPKALVNFAFAVTPMHYYSNPKASSDYNIKDGYDGYNPEKGHHGFPMGDAKYADQVFKDRDILGLPVGAGIYQVSNSNNDTDISKISVMGATNHAFWNGSNLYYIRNEYFKTVGSGLSNAKIKRLRYHVVNSNVLFDAVKKGEVHYADPSAKIAVMDQLNNPKEKNLKYVAQTNNGYGYIGINPKFIPDLKVRQAIMHAMDISLTLAYYPVNLASNIHRPMTTASWAYPDEKVYPKAYEPYYDSTVNKVFNEEQAKTKIKQLVKDAGYLTYNNDGVLYRSIEGWTSTTSKLEYTFTVAGGTDDHPAYSTLSTAMDILNDCGFKIKVSPDANALKRMSTGDLHVWAAAWSSSIDPDMFQIYHKDSKATSPLNWGYDVILGLNGREPYGTYIDEREIINNLSALIDKARTTLDQEDKEVGEVTIDGRKTSYAKALDLIMSLAIELPTYQRSNIYVYNKNTVDENSLEKEITAFQGPLAKMWNLSFAGN